MSRPARAGGRGGAGQWIGGRRAAACVWMVPPKETPSAACESEALPFLLTIGTDSFFEGVGWMCAILLSFTQERERERQRAIAISEIATNLLVRSIAGRMSSV